MSDRKILLITGGNTGLGLETVKALANSKTKAVYHIIVGSRRAEAGENAITSVLKEFPDTQCSFETIPIDVQDDASITNAFEHVNSKHGRLDVLVNNAGGGFDSAIKKGDLSVREAWNKAWDINVTGTYIMTSTFVPLLLASKDPRILFITSGTSQLETFLSKKMPNFQVPAAGWPKDNALPRYVSYQSSKTGMNMMVADWALTLENDGVKVFNISPGFLATGLGGIGAELLKSKGALDPAVGGDTVRTAVEGERDADAGGRIINRQGIQPW